MNPKSLCDPRNAVPRTGSKIIGVFAASLVVGVCLFASSAGASVYTLAPSGNNPANASIFPTGGTLVGSNSFAFNSGTLDGTILSLVYQGDPSNPYGGLTFTYSLTLFADSTDSISESTVGSYGGFQTDVSYNSGTGVAPSTFGRSAGNGDILRFFFSNGGGISPNENGATVVVQTDAQHDQLAMGGVIDSIPANVAILAPVPEPAIGSLLATGLGVFFFCRRRSN